MTLSVDELVKLFLNHGYLISSDAAELIRSRFTTREEILQLISRISARDRLVVDREVVEEALDRRLEPEPVVEVVNLYKVPNIEPNIEGFKSYFRSRFRKLTRILKGIPSMRGAIPIANASRLGGEVRVIGMVYSVGNRHIEIEDETGRIRVILPQDFRGIVLPDEVVGVVGRVRSRGDVIAATEIVKPGFSRPPKPEIREHFRIAIISDIHVGSKKFLEREFRSFLSWLRDSGVKYLLVNGDLVDGVGIYPDQEEELEIKDVDKQYERLAELLSQVPRSIRIFMIPGNHDAVRQAEPQPPLPEDICSMFPENVQCLSNPAWLNLEGVRILMYHGTSLNDIVESMPNADYQNFDDALKEMLRARHLAPIYGRKLPIAPEKEDYLVIEEVPHILVTGHIHSTRVIQERGVYLVNASAWQSQTRYQKLMNFHPVPARALVFDTRDWSFRELDFSSPR